MQSRLNRRVEHLTKAQDDSALSLIDDIEPAKRPNHCCYNYETCEQATGEATTGARGATA